nr:unnamed protein product [Callosobruchus analis]
MSALGQGLNALLESSMETKTKELILKHLNDAGRCLASLSHNITYNRRKMLTPLLSKTVKEVAEQTTPTELLFGDNLRDQIKTARLLENESKELKATYSTTPKRSYVSKKGGGAKTYSAGPSSSSYQGNVNRPARRRPLVRETWQHKGRPSQKRYSTEKDKYSRRK